jgi:4-oxalocrotonate tautomerase
MVLIDEVIDGGWGRADEVLTLAKVAERAAGEVT